MLQSQLGIQAVDAEHSPDTVFQVQQVKSLLVHSLPAMNGLRLSVKGQCVPQPDGQAAWTFTSTNIQAACIQKACELCDERHGPPPAPRWEPNQTNSWKHRHRPRHTHDEQDVTQAAKLPKAWHHYHRPVVFAKASRPVTVSQTDTTG